MKVWQLLIISLIVSLLAAGYLHNMSVIKEQNGIKEEMQSKQEHYESIITEQNEHILFWRNKATEYRLQINDLKEESDSLHQEIQNLRTIPAVVTSYAPLDPNAVEGWDYAGDPSITSTGQTVGHHIAAVCPERIPYGTRLYVPDYGEVVAGDTGATMRNSDRIWIDVFQDTKAQARSWGKQELEIIILD